jgi:putative ABC transport system permease protein
MSSPLEASSLVMAIDPITYPQVTSMRLSDESSSNAMEELDNSGNIILADPLARKLNASVGELVGLKAAGNSTTWNFTIIGVAEGAFMEMMSFGDFALGDASYVSYKTLNSTFPEYIDDANLFFVKAKADQDIDYIEEQIVETYEYDLFILTYTDILQTIQGFIDEMFVILYSVVLFAVVNAAIGVAAIMVMNVSERKHEIGILRSQGMSRPQVISSIVGEAAVLGVVGFLVGSVIGLIFHRITIAYMSLMGFPMEFFVPYDSIIIILFLALVTSIMSAVYPAFRASRLNIVDAIRGEKI